MVGIGISQMPDSKRGKEAEAEALSANGQQVDQVLAPAFKEFGLSELRTVTNGFSSELIVSESGEKAPNAVYKGKLRNNRFIAIKRFSKQSWPDPQQFVV
ncbi:hypothetical protein CDL15_Pgr021345 [Punica granatum]|uniref:Protein kinase domain-containing protein n=1 Tax=Punica granatum TaxID=22663 RepID=A0A218WQ72_PUNGR|nr:hypothetical protein CDL15_Pgr021345 [Punica granatum]